MALEGKDTLRQNLADAGCGAALTERFVSLVEAGREGEALALLAGHRRTLLEHCHTAEKRIDCLDYLVYHMEKKAKGKETV